jgi:molybdate transport system permease protein
MPPVVTGYLLLVLLGRNSAFGSWLNEVFGVTLAFSASGAAAAAAVVSFPLMVRSVKLAVDLVDPRLEEAARTLGASRAGTFCTVTLPLAVPGIVTGFVLAFARSLGEFGATITFAGNIAGKTRTIPMAIYTALQTPGGEDPVLRMTILSLLLCLLALAASEVLARKARFKLGLES